MSAATPNIGTVPEHLRERMKKLITCGRVEADPTCPSYDDDERLRNNANEYMQMLSALNDSAQVIGCIQSVFDHYTERMYDEDDPGAVLLSAMKDLRLASSWR